jgi:sulfate adenylyltransferase subunit 1
MSALDGDNVVNISERSPWYTGQPLMEILETAEVAADKNISDFRFPVQYVNRPNLDFRGFCGTIASGIVKVGDTVSILPSGKTSSVNKIVTYEGDLQEAFVDQAVTLILNDEVDISRGDVIVHANAQVDTTNHMQAHLVWMSESQLNPGGQYFFKFSSKLTTGTVTVINHQVDVNSQEFLPKDHLDLNDIAHVEVELNQQVVIDPYSQNRATGAFIMIDRLTNITVSAGMVTQVLKTSNESLLDPTDISEFEEQLKILIDKHFPNKRKNKSMALIRKIRSFCQ